MPVWKGSSPANFCNQAHVWPVGRITFHNTAAKIVGGCCGGRLCSTCSIRGYKGRPSLTTMVTCFFHITNRTHLLQSPPCSHRHYCNSRTTIAGLSVPEKYLLRLQLVYLGPQQSVISSKSGVKVLMQALDLSISLILDLMLFKKVQYLFSGENNVWH